MSCIKELVSEELLIAMGKFINNTDLPTIQ